MLSGADAAPIHTLWDELAEFDAAQTEEARAHLLTRLCELTKAQNATWICTVRMGDAQPGDAAMGWRPRVYKHLRQNAGFETTADIHAALVDKGHIDPLTLCNLKRAGNYRVNTLEELAPEGWFEDRFYEVFYRANGYRDAIWAVIPVNQDAEMHFGFYRSVSEAPFSAEDKETISYALRSLKWLYRLLFLAEGIGVVSAPLTPAEQRVLQGLLQGLKEKEIAAAAGLSPHTAHDHVKSIFRKYGVSSRASLMALWLGAAP